MTGLKDIKNRIKSVSSTHKLTSAMRLIATAKLRHTMAALTYIRNYENTLIDSIKWANFNSIREIRENFSDFFPKFFFEADNTKPHAVLVIGSNRGLCGNYNLTIIREALAFAQSQKKNQSNIRFIPLTYKTSEYFLKHEKDCTGNIPGLGFNNKASNIDLASIVLNQAINWLKDGDWGAVSIIYGKFINALFQKAEYIPLFPFFDEKMEFFWEKRKNFDKNEAKIENPPNIEPSQENILPSLIYSLAYLKICRAFVESETCEHAARMTIMEGAKKNAESLIDTLTLQYNRTRQANITGELIEIIAGTNAMAQE
ncbi:MAG: ATP synthase F1 subunit gamma [Holosporales bacterium]|jgi:F-type H+-transporting ATPase subunit gamma|nr:ATP synthase F1 subunit gamma [Holosporales bacterium]